MTTETVQRSRSLVSELITLSIHEALTFEGVELAISPDIFKDSPSNISSPITNSSPISNTSLLKPGDFVELRIWDPHDQDTLAKTNDNFEWQRSSDSRNDPNSPWKNAPFEQATTPNDNIGTESTTDEHTNMIQLLSKSHNLRVSLVMIVTEKSLTTLKTSGRSQVSLLRPVAELYSLSSFDLVTVTKISKEEENCVLQSVQAEFLTVTIKDQFISRGEMHQFQQSFALHWIYSGQRLCTDDGMRGSVAQIRHGDGIVKTAIVTENTKFTFRSRSARIIWLVQISSEMWDYHSPYESAHKDDYECGTYFDKFVSFMHGLFEKWKAYEATHSLTVIFFSRTFHFSNKDYTSRSLIQNHRSEDKLFLQKDIDGRVYEDHYKVVVENETRTDWDALIYTVKKAFVSFPLDLGWTLGKNWSTIPSTSSQGNLLEAINTTLNMLHNHYMDRDLRRTGNSIVIITAGSGVFEVDKNLAGITKQRMMDNGIGSDMLSLGLPPLHIAPFFLYKEALHATEAMNDNHNDWKALFEIPHWMHLSFVSYDGIGNKTTEQKSSTPSYEMAILPHGFISRTPCNSCDKVTELTKSDNYRHFLSNRDFEDILAACRPRNHGEYNSALPSTLLALLDIFRVDSLQPSNSGCVMRTDTGESAARTLSHNNDGSTLRRKHDLDTLSSSFNSAFSFLRDRKPNFVASSPLLDVVQIQQSAAFEIPMIHLDSVDRDNLSRNKSDESLSTRGDDKNTNFMNKMKLSEDIHSNHLDPGLISNKWREVMIEHDKSIYKKYYREEAPQEHSKLMSVKRKDRKQVHNAGGIGAALVQFDNHMTQEHTKEENNTPKNKKSTVQAPRSAHYYSKATGGALDRLHSEHDADLHNISRSPKAADCILDISPRNETALARSFFQTPELWSRPRRAHTDQNVNPLNATTTRRSRNHNHRKLWTLNPFRQSDEEQVLAERTYNSRRWSHVFPQGEIEFKRHPGPNWNSLTQPAILPITIDFHPPPQELNDPSKYQFKHYEVMLDAMDLSNYGTHAELLMEMVRQRLVQDFQLVPSSILNHSKGDRKDTVALQGSEVSDSIIQHTLSMGHRIQVLTYNPNEENNAIKVVQYLALLNLHGNTHNYHYKLWCPTTRTYIANSQTFQRYPAEYPWNQFDNLICGDLKKELTGATRFRRLNYRIIPDQFKDASSELDYLKKFKRFLEYVEKQVQHELGIQLNAKLNNEIKVDEDGRKGRSYKSFTIPLRKSRHEKFEWIEMVLDSVFDTSRAYHIKFQWLVASAIRVEALIQLMQRRCIQYGLRLIGFPQTSISSNMILHPFIRPMTVKVSDKNKALLKEKGLVSDFNFIDDGYILVDPKDALDAFGVVLTKHTRRYSEERTQQYVHVSGLLFVRIFHDESGWTLFAFMGNRRLIGMNEDLKTIKLRLFEQVCSYLNT